MNKYVRYAMWLAKTIIAVAAVVAFVKYFVTNENVYVATFAAYTAVFMCFMLCDRLKELSERVAIIDRRQNWFMTFEKVIYTEQLDCKERVDKLADKLNGGE